MVELTALGDLRWNDPGALFVLKKVSSPITLRRLGCINLNFVKIAGQN